MRRAIWVIAFLGLAAAASPVAIAAGQGRPRLFVLFVGNSYTKGNRLPEMVKFLALADRSSPRLVVRARTEGSARLLTHWRERRVVWNIQASAYTHVVLQGHSLSALDRPEEMEEYARRFERTATRAGSRLVLYETWARSAETGFYDHRDLEGPAEMQAEVDRVYRRLARELEADLAPVGDAFLRANTAAPDIRLRAPDGHHPSRRGSYLAACVIHSVITGRDPIGNHYRPRGIEADEALRIQQVAHAVLEGPRPADQVGDRPTATADPANGNAGGRVVGEFP